MQSVNDGHVYLEQEVLLRRAGELLGVEIHDIEKYLMDLAIEKKVVMKKAAGGMRVYSSHYYYMELNVAKMLHDLNVDYKTEDAGIEDRLLSIEENADLCLDEKQRTAVLEAWDHGADGRTGHRKDNDDQCDDPFL